jgi:transposase
MGGRKYNDEFKAEVIRAIRENGRSIRGLCRDLGVTEQSVYRWLKEAEAPRNEESKRIAELEKQLKEANRKVEDLEESVDILKKAAAIFASTKHRK